MPKCPRCEAEVPVLGILAEGTEAEEGCCCQHCAFHPYGCRCKFGEYGVAEEVPPWFYDDDYEDPDEDEMYRDCEVCGGEFWDGGTSCTCEDWEADQDGNDWDFLLDDLEEGGDS